MLLIRLIRFFTGYIVFTCSGGFPERFINLCSLNGINLWDVKAAGGILCAKTTIKCYKNIRPCARKSGMKIKIKSKAGFPFIIKPYIKRKGIAAGALISAVLTVFLCSCVWTIDVTGNEKFTKEQILTIAENYGIYSGAFRKNIDAKEIKTAVKSDISGISWFSVNINGGNVSLEVTESSGSDEIIDYSTPCNIVSGLDGELLKLEAHAGTPAVKPGNAVTKGCLLISGVVEKTDGSSEFIHARGTAVIRTNKNISSEIPHNISVLKTNGNKKFYMLKIFGLTVPVSCGNLSDIQIKREKKLSFRGTELPVGIITTNTFSLKKETMNFSENRAILLACNSAFVKEMQIMQNATTETKSVNIYSDNNASFVTVDYINHETTGIENYLQITRE